MRAPRVIGERGGSPAGTSTSSGWTHRTRGRGILFPRIARLGKTAESSSLTILTYGTKEWIRGQEMVAESERECERMGERGGWNGLGRVGGLTGSRHVSRSKPARKDQYSTVPSEHRPPSAAYKHGSLSLLPRPRFRIPSHPAAFPPPRRRSQRREHLAHGKRLRSTLEPSAYRFLRRPASRVRGRCHP